MRANVTVAAPTPDTHRFRTLRHRPRAVARAVLCSATFTGMALALTTAGAPAHAATAAEKCARTIAKETGKHLQAVMKTLDKCNQRTLQGKVGFGPLGDACTDTDGKTAGKLQKASSKLAAKVDKACGGDDKLCGTVDDVPLADIGWDIGTCPGAVGGCMDAVTDCGGAAASGTGITDCAQCVNDAMTSVALAQYYGDLLPGDPGSALGKCQKTLGKETTKFLLAKAKALGKCLDALLNGKDGFTDPPGCPTTDAKTVAKIDKATSKHVVKICKACGGPDQGCDGLVTRQMFPGTGGDDDLTPAQIGFGPTCTDVSSPDAGACAAPVDTLEDIIECAGCVSEVAADTSAAAGVPAQLASTPTPTAEGPGTPTPTLTPNPTPAASACPARLAFTTDAAVLETELDLGWTGRSHDQPLGTEHKLTLAVSGCSDPTNGTANRPCGVCALDGPLLNPNIGAGDVDTLRCTCDTSVKCAAASDCPGSCPCAFHLGAPVPLFPTSICLLHELAAPVTGTVDVESGDVAMIVALEQHTSVGQSANEPCPRCLGDVTFNDGIAEGTCTFGARQDQPCDANSGHPSPPLGPTSFDCPPSTVLSSQPFSFTATTAGQTLAVTAGTPSCRAFGWTSRQCLCDTCATAAAEPCLSDADCPAVSTCGGRRCIGGTNAGTPCTLNSECTGGGVCGVPGEPTQPHECSGPSDCLADPNDPTGAQCNVTTDVVCSPTETWRACGADSDCPFPGDLCAGVKPRPCFYNGEPTDTIVALGAADPPVNDLAAPTLGAVTCMNSTTSSAVNMVMGLPGPARLTQHGVLELLPPPPVGQDCGNGRLDPGESCDPPGSTTSGCSLTAGNGLQVCTDTCQCACPGHLAFTPDASASETELDFGWTGTSHDNPLGSEQKLTLGVSACTDATNGTTNKPCGVCALDGPVPNPNAGAGDLDTQRCTCDTSVRCGAASDCPGSCTCAFHLGAPVPLVSGLCLLQELTAPVTGTVDVESGGLAMTVEVEQHMSVGQGDEPCPRCLGDLTVNDGVTHGTCTFGARQSEPCDANSANTFPTFGPTSLDCPPSTVLSSESFSFTATTAGQTATVAADTPVCRAFGWSSRRCFCDTCATAAAEPCLDDADCPAASTCGGTRCIGGTNAGTPCTAGSECTGGGVCGIPGAPTQPHACFDASGCPDVDSPDPNDPAAGECPSWDPILGPPEKVCTPTETWRACLVASDCPHPGDQCLKRFRRCFYNGEIGDTIDAAGAADPPVNDLAAPTLGAVTCMAPTGSSAINTAAGLPGPARLTQAGVLELLPEVLPLPVPPAHVVFNAVASGGGGSSDEWVELRNVSCTDFDLHGCIVSYHDDTCTALREVQLHTGDPSALACDASSGDTLDCGLCKGADCVIPAGGGHFTIVGTQYLGAPTDADVELSQPEQDNIVHRDGGLILTCDAEVMDTAGWDDAQLVTPPCFEFSPGPFDLHPDVMTRAGDTPGQCSIDTDQNDNDFMLDSVRSPFSRTNSTADGCCL